MRERFAPKKIIIDYGGPNIAKPLHVGHMRSAVIGESLKRIFKFMGNEAIGDVHLGDWGTPMGLVIAELKRRKPDLIYFDESYTENIQKKLPLPYQNLKRFILQPVHILRRTLSLVKKQNRLPI